MSCRPMTINQQLCCILSPKLPQVLYIVWFEFLWQNGNVSNMRYLSQLLLSWSHLPGVLLYRRQVWGLWLLIRCLCGFRACFSSCLLLVFMLIIFSIILLQLVEASILNLILSFIPASLFSSLLFSLYFCLNLPIIIFSSNVTILLHLLSVK